MVLKCKIWNIIENLIYSVLSVLFKAVGKELSDDIFKLSIQFVKFGIIGVSNTAVAYVIYAVCLLLFHKMTILPKADYLAAQAVGFVLGTFWSFYWNNKMVFTLQEGEKRSIWQALIKTFISYSFTGLFLNTVLLVLWVQIIHISEYIAPVINLIINVPLNFIINKFWAFKKKGRE